jgi:hypothetical protein
MEKAKILLKRLYYGYYPILITLLNIASSIACAKTKTHGEPFMVIVPISYIFLSFIFFAKETDQKEISRRERYGRMRSALRCIFLIIFVLSLMTNFTLLLVRSLEELIPKIYP